ncbi:MAG TPA: M20/M25/M40 family metallo-hydrolase [Bryobacteraceae bacterium]|nr:M20/M25/M40 family metallo-hydrolase [Bryobacteraceae bacterium]HPT28754.1 M20/M25/M40 family metallo-hydrolase [Bryobacteraceae bacterium]
MPTETLIEKELLNYVETRRDDLIALIQTLVRTPSENTPPSGAEAACQRFCQSYLESCGFSTDLYELSSIPGLETHPLFYPGRDYTGRPNLAATLKGSGGRSLILSGHIDTVPRGTLPWTRDPFSGHVENGRLYGRGSNDMKSGIATNLFVARAFHDLGLAPVGDLTIECVVDEEFGGVNGTLAGRLRGYLADAAVVSEPSFLRICPAQRGGRTAHITFQAPNAGILSDSMEVGVSDQLAWFLSQVPGFAALRRASAPAHFAYAHLANPVPVSVMKIHTGPWGTNEPMATANNCKVELFWQSMPGEGPEQIDGQFHSWLHDTVSARPDLFPEMPRVEFPLRWLPGSSIALDDPLIQELSISAAEVLGAPPAVAGIEGPCDMYVFHQQFGIPTVLWGASGANTHLADEYVDIESVVSAAKALLLFVHRWGLRPRVG